MDKTIDQFNGEIYLSFVLSLQLLSFLMSPKVSGETTLTGLLFALAFLWGFCSEVTPHIYVRWINTNSNIFLPN